MSLHGAKLSKNNTNKTKIKTEKKTNTYNDYPDYKRQKKNKKNMHHITLVSYPSLRSWQKGPGQKWSAGFLCYDFSQDSV